MREEGRATSARIEEILSEEIRKEEAKVAEGEAWVRSVLPSVEKLIGAKGKVSIRYCGFTVGRRTYTLESAPD
jgi:hypothetical protein